jgi:dTDP-4-dehydrorhamnose 3,5-epimerase
VNADALGFRGVYLLTTEFHRDERGDFRRVVDFDVLRSLGVESDVCQVSTVTNERSGTLRGMHYQAEPNGEAKTLWCYAGEVFDVLVDLRPDEPTYGDWLGVHLSSSEPTALHVPRGIAHGYQTLQDSSMMTYLISVPYVAESARSLRFDDPSVGIEWPLEVAVISDRDRNAPSWPPN